MSPWSQNTIKWLPSPKITEERPREEHPRLTGCQCCELGSGGRGHTAGQRWTSLTCSKSTCGTNAEGQALLITQRKPSAFTADLRRKTGVSGQGPLMKLMHWSLWVRHQWEHFSRSLSHFNIIYCLKQKWHIINVTFQNLTLESKVLT